MFLAKSLHTPGVIVALLLALVMVGCRPPSPGELETIMLPGDVPLEMVWIPAGTFMMGRYPGEPNSDSGEDPQHQVTVPGFWMAKYELTKRQWQAVMGTTPGLGLEHVLDELDSPAVFVSWNDAKAFINALNTHTGLTFRLPSEAEWEYACRAGTTTRFYWGDDPDYTQIGNYAWYSGNCSSDVNYAHSEMYAHRVGQKLVNGFGLYDMSGNVREWCEDDWHGTYAEPRVQYRRPPAVTAAPTDGSAWVNSPRDSYRVTRGGGWDIGGNYCRSARRFSNIPSYTYFSIGFRLSR